MRIFEVVQYLANAWFELLQIYQQTFPQILASSFVGLYVYEWAVHYAGVPRVIGVFFQLLFYLLCWDFIDYAIVKSTFTRVARKRLIAKHIGTAFIIGYQLSEIWGSLMWGDKNKEQC